MVIEDAPAPRAFHNLEDPDIRGLLRNPGTISREALLHASRGELKRYLSCGPSKDDLYEHNVQKLWWALLATMRDSSVVEGHMTAACNAICVFLQSASSSPILSIQTFAMSVDIWLVVFDALLQKFNDGKLKSLRQVLNTLIKILARHHDSTRVCFIQHDILSKMADIILLGKPVSHFKASMVIFEAFFRSDVPKSRILSAIGRSHGSNHDHWDHCLRRRGFDSTELLAAANHHVVDESIYCFGFSVVLAIADSTVQATAGSFVSSFMFMLTDYSVCLDSFWIELVVTALRRYPKAIDAFKNYLLPSLFELQSSHFNDLLHRVASEDAGFSMFQNALTIIVLGRDKGFLSEKDIASTLSAAFEEGQELLLQQDSDDLDETKLYAALLTHASVGVRIRAYELVATSRGRTKPIQSSVLTTLSKNFVHIHGDTDPASRDETNSITVTMTTRLRHGKVFHARALARLGLTDQQHREHSYELKKHEQFLDWFICFLEDELGPNCSFPRKLSSLKALESLWESRINHQIPTESPPRSGQDFVIQLFKKPLRYQNMKSSLWHLFLDPFEDVRATALHILKLFLEIEAFRGDLHEHDLPNNLEVATSAKNIPLELSAKGKQSASCPEEEIARVAEEANKLAALTNRADHSDGVGRLLWLQHLFSSKKLPILSNMLERLDNTLDLADIDTAFFTKKFSFHGYLIGLKYIVEYCGLRETFDQGIVLNETNITLNQLLHVCKTVWRAVQADLCVDSPEMGHDDDVIGPFDGPKDFLSFSWRALRDSSLLMQAILLHVKTQAHETLVGDGAVAHLRTIYALCFEQLTALRHRGAFSTVAQTFTLCCERFAHVPSLRAEFQNCYQVRVLASKAIHAVSSSAHTSDFSQEALQILEDQSSKLTRRSAGIPAIMSGLLIPSIPEDFNAIIATLASIVRLEKTTITSATVEQQIRLPQVHALNCLREIFTNSRFKSRTVFWLIEVLDLAASSLSDQIWAVRNCGLMLFRACASHIGAAAGTDEYGMDVLRYLDRSEAILGIAFRLLDSGGEVGSDCSELHFAGLDLLSRLAVPQNDQSQTRQRILAQLRSPVWMIREHAARVYASQMPETEALEAATRLICSMAFNDQNRCHGILLCSHRLLRKHVKALLPNSDASRHAFEQSLRDHAPFIDRHAAPAVQHAFVSISNDCATLNLGVRVQLQTSFCRQRFCGCHKESKNGAQIDRRRPFDSQLQVSLALHASLTVLAGQETGTLTLPEIFQHVVVYDLDAAAALLQALTNQVPDIHNNLRLVADFYVDVILENQSEDVTTAALLGISECLEHSPRKTDSVIADPKIGSLVENIANMSYSGSRNCSDAKIRALGSLLAYKPERIQSIWSRASSRPLNLWIKMLSIAAKDATETLTRLNAAKSLHCFKSCLVEASGSDDMYGKLILFSTLYDFLNDDDEEIRDLAARTTSFILTSAAAGVESQLCPLAACHQFSAYLGQVYSSKHEFHVITFCRLMFSMTTEIDDLDDFAALASHHSVKQQLDLARHMSYDLFEEERQNLYLDSIREIYVWHSVLAKISRTWMKDEVLSTVRHWALEGLHELTAALPSLENGTFGVMSKLETISLFVRVIKVAELLQCWEYSCYVGPEPLQGSAYQIELERLLHLTRKCPVHPQVQRALEHSIQIGRLDLEQFNAPRKRPLRT